MLNKKQLNNPIVNNVTNRIVFTGGPLGGKSTIMSYLEGVYKDKAGFMTEVASMLLTNGYPKPGSDVSYSEAWLDYINETIIPTQIAMENGHLHAAVENHKNTVFFDRGLLDPAAYLPNGYDTMVERYGIDIDMVKSRYSMVIHLQSLACHSTEEYERLCGTNPARYDTAAMAIERDRVLMQAWKNHPNLRIIPANTSMEEKIQLVLSILHPIMNVEVERKYLLREIPYAIIEEALRKEVCQYYMVQNSTCEMRVRSYDNSLFELCVKDKGMEKRMEWETKIPSEVFNILKNESCPKIEKTRYYVPYGEYILEIDVYHGVLSGLCTMECEFTNTEQINKFTLPQWAKNALDITNDPEYKNANMAC